MISPSDKPALAAKIDWYSFTLPCPTPFLAGESDHLDRVSRLLDSLFGPLFGRLDDTNRWTVVLAKGFYSFRATDQLSKIAVSWGEVNSHVFVECSGQACDFLRASMVFAHVVKATYQRASRIDAAIDICTQTTPADFLACGYAERFSESTGDIRTKTGTTYYVGSRKSDRCARVYRYADPHPRQHLLRVETEFKGRAARALAVLLAEKGEMDAVRSAHRVFEWASGELMLNFLALPSSIPDRVTGPVTVSIDGSWTPFFQPLPATNEKDWWTLERGLKTYYYQRFKTTLWTDWLIQALYF